MAGSGGGTGSGNASVNYTCKRCKAKLVNGLKCSICNNYFHNSCAKLLSNVVFLDESLIKCCENDNPEPKLKDSDEDLYDALCDLVDENNKIDVRIINYLIRQKDNVIIELREKVNILTDQLNLVTSLLSPVNSTTLKTTKCLKATSDVVNNSATTSVDIKETDASSVCVDIDKCDNNMKEIDNPDFVHITESNESNIDKRKLIINKSELENNSKQELWTTVVKRNNNNYKSKQIIVGDQCSSKDSRIKTVPKKAYLFVSRLDPDTTVEMLSKYIKENFAEAICEPLKSRYPETYASFKITINMDNLSKAMDASVWPMGALVTRYFLKKPGEVINGN